jgi:hypothetical protein
MLLLHDQGRHRADMVEEDPFNIVKRKSRWRGTLSILGILHRRVRL